jgi:hypothetical protein
MSRGGAQVAACAGLRFLDIFDKLLTPDGQALRPEFELDGTHMSPRYVRLVEEALNAGAGPELEADADSAAG